MNCVCFQRRIEHIESQVFVCGDLILITVRQSKTLS